jgi:hypothetical protein
MFYYKNKIIYNPILFGGNMSKTKKKRYIDNDTRAELSKLKNIQFKDEESLELKLEEIHRKKNQRFVSRIIRVFGFIFLLLIFITACDTFYEGSIFGAWTSPNEHAEIMDSFTGQTPDTIQILPKDHIKPDGTKVGKYVNIEYVDNDSGDTIRRGVMTPEEIDHLLSNPDRYTIVSNLNNSYRWEYLEETSDKILTSNGKYSVIRSSNYIQDNGPQMRASYIAKYGEEFIVSVDAATANFDNSSKTIITAYSGGSAYDDSFQFGISMVKILFTAVLLTLLAALIYLSIFTIRDFVDLIRNFFGGSINVVGSAVDSVREGVGVNKSDTPEEPTTTRRSLFSDEELAAEAAEAEKRSGEDRRRDDTEPTKPEHTVEETKESEVEKIRPEDLDKLLSSN